ncbi:MAG: hypothetical protein M3R27_09555 [Bacteroidota bacterium]|nr:hypothetical protein [Bacteroidota bacterium]
MTKITTVAELRESIQLLEIKQKEEGKALKAELMATYEGMRPSNLLKKALRDITQAPDLKGDLINATIGLAAGFLTKKATVGDSSNPLKQLLGTFLQMGVTSLVSKNANFIKDSAIGFISNFLKNKESKAKDE